MNGQAKTGIGGPVFLRSGSARIGEILQRGIQVASQRAAAWWEGES